MNLHVPSDPTQGFVILLAKKNVFNYSKKSTAGTTAFYPRLIFLCRPFQRLR